MVNNLQNKQDVQEIDLLKLLKVLWSKIWLIVLAAFVGGVAFFLYTFFFITPLYQSSALLYVNNNSLDIGSTKLNITSGDINASSSLIDTYCVILKSRTTLEQARYEGQLPYTYEQLRSKVSGSSEGNTPIFKITVTDPNPEMAANICNTVVEIMIDPNSGISGIVEGSSMKVVSYPVIPSGQFAPSPKRNTAMGVLSGLVIMIALVLWDLLSHAASSSCSPLWTARSEKKSSCSRSTRISLCLLPFRILMKMHQAATMVTAALMREQARRPEALPM